MGVLSGIGGLFGGGGGGQKLQIQYDDMDAIANDFKTMADDTQQFIQNIENTMRQLEGGDWKGVGAQKFYDEMNSEVLPKLKILQQGYEVASQQIKQIASNFHDAEQTILSYFSSL